MLDTHSEIDLSLLIDFEAEVPCSHSEHRVLLHHHDSGPAVWRVTYNPCGMCGHQPDNRVTCDRFAQVARSPSVRMHCSECDGSEPASDCVKRIDRL